MVKAYRIQARWRWPALIGLNLLAIALLASWITPSTRLYWEQANVSLFLLLNGSLGHSSLWDGFWALCSIRVFDIFVAAILLCLTIHSRFVFAEYETRRALLYFFSLLALLLIARVLFSKLISHMDWQHASPSVQIAGSFHLSDHYPLLERVFELKDRSSRSFPGDHASVLLLWALFMGCFARGWKLMLSLGLVVLFFLPRLVAGAHWLVDVAVGGSFLALIAFAWGYCTPLAGWMADGLERLLTPLLPWLQKLPLIRSWSVLSPRLTQDSQS